MLFFRVELPYGFFGISKELRFFSPEDADSTLLRNVGFYQLINTMIQPNRTSSEFSPP
jgi:hypothetical protein